MLSAAMSLHRPPVRLPHVLAPTLALIAGLAPGEEAPGVVTSEEVIAVSATRLTDPASTQPYAIHEHSATQLNQSPGRTQLDRLGSTPGVFLQRTAPNQASPYLRGLTGEQTLLLFDGIRLNHALMRPGPNQYAAMIPEEAVGRIDTILGSSSTVTGSDGLTGALDLRLAEAGRGVDSAASPWLGGRVSTAEGYSTKAGLDGTLDGWAYSVDGGYTDYHDLIGGKDAGEHLFGSAAGDREIPNSAYDQYSYGGRVAITALARNRFELAAGYQRQNEAPRPDGYFENSGVTVVMQAGGPLAGQTVPGRISRFYDPQEFTYLHARHRIELEGPIDSIQTTVWWHEHHEVQVREDIQTNNAGLGTRYRRRENDDEIDTVGGDVQLTSQLGSSHGLTYGGTLSEDTTDTRAKRYRSPNNSIDPDLAVLDQDSATNAPGTTTVPDDAEYQSYAVFLQDAWRFAPTWELLTGVRYSRSSWDFTVTDDRAGFDFIDGVAGNASPTVSRNFSESTDAITGSVRLGWQTTEQLYTFTGVGQGFRAPNLSNLAGIQDRGSSSSGGTGPQTQGNPDLDPETSITVEAGGRWIEGLDGVSLGLFVTQLRDLHQTVYTDVDSDGDIDAADRAERVNGEKGLLVGGELGFDWAIPTGGLLPDGWRLAVVNSASYVSGEADVPNAASGGGTHEENISRANLFYGKTGLRLAQANGVWYLTQVRWQDRYDEIAPGDATDTRHTTFRAKGDPAGAMPGYAVLDLVVGYDVPGDRIHLSAGLENVLDHTYRAVGSGTDGAGISGYLSLMARL